jgi:hypothetical protein
MSTYAFQNVENPQHECSFEQITYFYVTKWKGVKYEILAKSKGEHSIYVVIFILNVNWFEKVNTERKKSKKIVRVDVKGTP